MFNALSQRISHASLNTQSENTPSSNRLAEQWHDQFAAAPRATTPHPLLRNATTGSRLSPSLASRGIQAALSPLMNASPKGSEPLNSVSQPITSLGIATALTMSPIMMKLGAGGLLTLNTKREILNANTHTPYGPCVLAASTALGSMAPPPSPKTEAHLASIPEREVVTDDNAQAKDTDAQTNTREQSPPTQNHKSNENNTVSKPTQHGQPNLPLTTPTSSHPNLPEQASPDSAADLANLVGVKRFSRESLISAISDTALESVNSKNTVSITPGITIGDEDTDGDMETISINTGDLSAGAQVLANGTNYTPDNSRNTSSTAPSQVSRTSAKHSFTASLEKGALIISGEETVNSMLSTKVPVSITLSAAEAELNCVLSVSSDDFGFEFLADECNHNSQQTIKRNTAERGWEFL